MRAESFRARRALRICLLILLLGLAAVLVWIFFAGSENELGGDAVEEVPRASLISEVDANAPPVFAPEPPIQTAKMLAATGYECTETLEVWNYRSNESCASFALDLLEELSEEGYELVQAGYLDVSGECWGCVLRNSDGKGFSIVLMPEEPFSPRSETNLLSISILRYLEPEAL